MTIARACLLGWSSVTPPETATAEGDWFDPDAYLGRRGHKYFSRGTKLWLAACTGLAALDPSGLDPDATGVSLGTNFGAHRTLREIEAVVVRDGAAGLSPSFAPNFCINLIASQAAIKYAARRFNLTITTPRTAGLDALAVAAREIAKGRCALVVAGAVEECESAPGSGVHGEGALATVLAPSGVDGGAAQLYGFAELTIAPTLWTQRPDLAKARLAGALWRHGMGDAARAARRLVVAAPASVPRRAVEIAFAELGCDAAVVHEHCPEFHGSLEPLSALQRHARPGSAALFAFLGDTGQVRLIGLA